MANDTAPPRLGVTVRRFESGDIDAFVRIWRECGWVNDATREALDWFIEDSDVWVAELEGAVEADAVTAKGVVRYAASHEHGSDLPAALVTAVNTGLAARRFGLATRATARAVQAAAEAGAVVAALGSFDQGFYDRLGFGTGTDVLYPTFDPGSLQVPVKARPAERLTLDDFADLHAAGQKRWRRHGAVTINRVGHTRASLVLDSEELFGLGYRDADTGELTHALWLGASNVESGPFRVRLMLYRDRHQLLELLALLNQIADQVQMVTLMQPPDVQIEALLDQPFRQRDTVSKGKKKAGIVAMAWWQMRITDVPACVAATRLPAGEVRFNLELTDPIEAYLGDDTEPEERPDAWRGVAGDWTITFGSESSAVPGRDASLPTLRTTVNAFTRLWLGVLPASGLAVTDPFEAPERLIERLDDVLRLPVPHVDWEF